MSQNKTAQEMEEYLNHNMIEPSEHLEALMKMGGIYFMNKQRGWMMIPASQTNTQVQDEERKEIYNKALEDIINYVKSINEESLPFIQNNQVGDDIRNKLTPLKNLIAILERYNPIFSESSEIFRTKESFREILQREIEQCKKSIEYLASLPSVQQGEEIDIDALWDEWVEKIRGKNSSTAINFKKFLKQKIKSFKEVAQQSKYVIDDEIERQFSIKQLAQFHEYAKWAIGKRAKRWMRDELMPPIEERGLIELSLMKIKELKEKMTPEQVEELLSMFSDRKYGGVSLKEFLDSRKPKH